MERQFAWAARGDITLAAGFLDILLPDFIDVDGCVLRKDRYNPENLAEWQRQYPGQRSRVEAMINHLHVQEDMFTSCDPASDDTAARTFDPALVDYVGKSILRCWGWALAEQYPDRTFQLDFWEGQATEDGWRDPEITFWQVDDITDDSG
jgi:hypothetical protein